MTGTPDALCFSDGGATALRPSDGTSGAPPRAPEVRHLPPAWAHGPSNLRLRYVMRLRRMRQVEVARRAGCSPSMVAHLERGTSGPSRTMAAAVAGALAVDPWDLFPDVMARRDCCAKGLCDDHKSPVCVCDEPEAAPNGSCAACGMLCKVSPALTERFERVRENWRRFHAGCGAEATPGVPVGAGVLAGPHTLATWSAA